MYSNVFGCIPTCIPKSERIRVRIQTNTHRIVFVENTYKIHDEYEAEYVLLTNGAPLAHKVSPTPHMLNTSKFIYMSVVCERIVHGTGRGWSRGWLVR